MTLSYVTLCNEKQRVTNVKVVYSYKMPPPPPKHRYQKQSCLVRSRSSRVRQTWLACGERSPLVEVIPANVGYREAQGGVKFGDPAGNDAQTLYSPVLLAALKEQLHAQTDPKEGLPCLQA